MTVPVGGNLGKRLRGTRLVAIDADWTWGDGAAVREPTDMILLRLLGRGPVPRWRP